MCCNPNVKYKDGTFYGPFLAKYHSPREKIPHSKMLEDVRTGAANIIPCGKCWECRMSYRRQWANRMELESYYHENVYFATMTYDNDHIPIHNVQTDEWYEGHYLGDRNIERESIYYKDFANFTKRLAIDQKRKFGVEKTIYFGCGEYGDKTARPHYHAIFFDLAIPEGDLKYKYRKGGYNHYTSEYFNRKWGKGITELCPADWACMSYVAGYVMKKSGNKPAKDIKMEYFEKGIFPEDRWMSQAIGKRYYEENKCKIYARDEIILKGGRVAKPSAYFDKLFDIDCGAQESIKDAETGEIICARVQSLEAKEIHQKRMKAANDTFWTMLKKTTQTADEYMETQSEVRKARAKRNGAIRTRDFEPL